MKKIIFGVCTAALLLPAVTLAGAPGGQITGYLTQTTLDVQGFGDDSGTGFGIKGWAMIAPNWFGHGEFQTSKLDDFDIKIDQLRLGGGYAGDMGNGLMWMAKGEFIDIGGDVDDSGFGAHGGLVMSTQSGFTFFGSLGYLMLDSDGLELNLGGQYAFNKQWGLSVDYRTYMGSEDDAGSSVDIDLNDLRVGVTFSFE